MLTAKATEEALVEGRWYRTGDFGRIEGGMLYLEIRMRDLIILGSLIIYFLSIVSAVILVQTYHEQAYINKLKARSTAISQEIGNLTTQAKQTELVKSYMRMRHLPLMSVTELQRLVPPEIMLDFISVDAQAKGVVRGEAAELSDVFKFVTTLENSPHLEKAQTKYTRRKKVKDKELTEFEIDLQVKL